MTSSSTPILTSSQYNRYVRSLIKLLVGQRTLNDWLMKDIGPRQIENAAILTTSWQRPPMIIDPNNEGTLWLGRLNALMNKRKLVNLDMEIRWSDPHMMVSLEKAITKGSPVLLRNCGESIDNMITPLVHHRNTAHEKDQEEEPRMILFCGRRTLCHPDFRLYLSTSLSKPQIRPMTSSSVTLINFGVSHDTLTEDLLSRAFAKIRPELYKERILALKNLQLQKETLYKFSETVKKQVLSGGGQEAMLSSPKALQFITNITDAKLQLASQLSNTQAILDDLDLLKDELYPVARRAALLYALIRSLAAVYPEYQFTMTYFLGLFDEAIGGAFPEEFFSENEGYEDGESSEPTVKKARPGSANSQTSNPDDGRENGDETKMTSLTDGENVEKDQTLEEQAEGSTKQAQPTETEGESVSTGAVQKLVHGSDSDELPDIELPETAPLPSQDVDYTSYTSTNVKRLMDSLTSMVYHRVKMCLFEEDRLLFSTLMCLNMKVESGEDITNEEMSLFLQGNPGLGMQLTLSDFDCGAPAPGWLCREKWEDILALSVLPGPMDSLCVNFASNAGAWKEWYDNPYPEKQPLPLNSAGRREIEEKEDAVDEEEVEKADEGTEKEVALAKPHPEDGFINDFHKLLILRMLRPDRLPSALVSYCHKHLALYDPEEEVFNVNEVLADAAKHWGVLILLPPASSDAKGHPASRIKLTKSPVDELLELAKAGNIPVERVVVTEGSSVPVEEAMDTAEKNEGWAVIESVHLASPDLVTRLVQHLQRIHKSRVHFKDESEKEGIQPESKFCVWITSEPDTNLPTALVQNLLKIAWNSILSYPELASKTESSGGEAKKSLDIFNPLSPRSYLKTSIASSIRLIPESLLDSLQSETPLTKSLVFGVALIHGILVARQLFGSVGLARCHPFVSTQIVSAVELVTSAKLRPSDKTEPSLEDLCHAIPNLVYSAMIAEEPDQNYVSALCRQVLTSIYKDPQSEIVLGGAAIPVPPTNVELSNYADWFEATATDKMTLQTLQLNTAVERGSNQVSSTKFITRLDRMFETQNMEAGDVAAGALIASISIVKLRSALDICMEKLPLLLELGDVPHTAGSEFDFPYHCPSIISMSSAESALMPESIGYVLLQECLWMNKQICHIRQEVHDLESSLLGGSGALPRRLLPTVHSLQEEYVPVSWIHPNCQPCTHSLVSWLEDLDRRYEQLNQWVRRSMVPTFAAGGELTDRPTIARGQLSKVWLGGLVNPQALLTSLRQERAILERVSLEEVSFEVVVMSSLDQDVDRDGEGGLFVTDLVLENADWDFDSGQLKKSSIAGETKLACVYLRPKVKRSASSRPIKEAKVEKEDEVNGVNEEEKGESLERGDLDERSRDAGICQLPLYMNKSRQIQVWSLPVKCPAPEENWTLCRAAFVLDPGLPEGGCKKSRAYLLLHRLPPMMRAPGEGEGEEEEAEEEEDLGDEDELGGEVILEEGGESTRSQLSYKPMTPKASPLPMGLGLQREPPMDEQKESSEGGEDDENRIGSQGSETMGESESQMSNEVNEDGAEQFERTREEGEEEEENKSSRGDEPEEELLDRQPEDARGKVGKGDDDENVIDIAAGPVASAEVTHAPEDGPEVIHPGSRQLSRSSQRPDPQSDTMEDKRATETSKSDIAQTNSRPMSMVKNGGRGREDTPPHAAEFGSKPPSREKLSSRESQNKPVNELKHKDEAETALHPATDSVVPDVMDGTAPQTGNVPDIHSVEGSLVGQQVKPEAEN